MGRGFGKGGGGVVNMENMRRHTDRLARCLVLYPALMFMPVPLADSTEKMEDGWWSDIREQAREEGSRFIALAENPDPENLPTIGVWQLENNLDAVYVSITHHVENEDVQKPLSMHIVMRTRCISSVPAN